jgi:putative CocE/NonD family hydrolase
MATTVVTRFPHEYTETEDCWIPLPDGCVLAAKLWLPDIAANQRVPTILEVLPYRKRDSYAPRDATHHRYFAGHGYATLRLDMRGSGDSGGVHGVFSFVAEQDDTLRVLEWIEAQPWSDGQVGMFGISWGGLQSIQAAARAPAQLKAVVPVAFPPDHYVYGQIFHGGCFPLRAVRWSGQVFGYKSRPPDPALVGDRWRAMWLERLEANVPQVIDALRHQSYGEYWRSRTTDFSAIRCPVYAVGGWADTAYVGSVSETVGKIDVPKKALIGPWGHSLPQAGVPGPAVGFLQEAMRWFDRWMRGEDNGVEHGPMLRAWIAQGVPALPYYAESPGRWVEEDTWPSPRIKARRLVLNSGGRLGARALASKPVTWASPQTLGLQCGELMPWFQHGPAPELPGDQREDDGKSLCFDTPPLARTTEILGKPVATITFSVDKPVAFLCVRLCDVAPDGPSTRVSVGIFNLTHRDGRDAPKPLVPDKQYTVEVPLVDTGYSFLKGHRIRVAVSTTYWPLVWPSPEAVTLTMLTGESAIALPVRPPRRADKSMVPFGPAETAAPVAKTVLKSGGRERKVTMDSGTGETVVEISDRAGRSRFDAIGLTVEAISTERYRLVEGEPLSTSAEIAWTWLFERDDWRVRTESSSKVTCTSTDFIVEARLEGWEGEARVFERSIKEIIPRNGN